MIPASFQQLFSLGTRGAAQLQIMADVESIKPGHALADDGEAAASFLLAQRARGRERVSLGAPQVPEEPSGWGGLHDQGVVGSRTASTNLLFRRSLTRRAREAASCGRYLLQVGGGCRQAATNLAESESPSELLKCLNNHPAAAG